MYITLKEQREKLMKLKWVRHSPYRDQACLVISRETGAMGYIEDNYVDSRYFHYLEEALDQLHPGWRYDSELFVSTWNDRYAKSFDQVLEVMDRAIKLWEAAEGNDTDILSYDR